MSRELINTWGDYQIAIDRLFALAQQKIFIYDEDLGLFKLGSVSRLQQLRQLMQAGQRDSLQMLVRNARPVRDNPLLLQLLGTYGHLASASETAESLAHLRDSMLLIDDRHALIRFERDQPRSKLLIDEPEELAPYLTRFVQIRDEGGEQISNTCTGL